MPDIDYDDVDAAMPANAADALPDGVGGAKRVVKPRPKFTVNDLMKETGLNWLTETMPKLVKPRGAGHEAQDCARLVDLYRQWTKKMFPKLTFDEMLQRIEKFGAQSFVRNHVENMRQDHRWAGTKRPREEPPEEPAEEDDHDEGDDPNPRGGGAADGDLKAAIAAKKAKALELRTKRALEQRHSDGGAATLSNEAPPPQQPSAADDGEFPDPADFDDSLEPTEEAEPASPVDEEAEAELEF